MVCDDDLKSPLIKWPQHKRVPKISYFLRTVILVGILFTIALLTLSWVSVVLMPYIQFMLKSFGITSITESDLLSSSTNLLLICITGIYVILTSILVTENQKTTEQNKIDRKIARIEKKLEKFYNPFYRILLYELEIQLVLNMQYVHLTHDSIENIESKAAPNFQVKQADNYTTLLYDLVYYGHLATEDIQEDLNSLINLITFKNKQLKMTLDDLKILMFNLEENVGFEIGHLRAELERLHGN